VRYGTRGRLQFGVTMAGRIVKLTAKGFPGASVWYFSISATRFSAEPCVSAEMVPRPPALLTAAAISAYPTYCIPPHRTGCSHPTSSVNDVRSGMCAATLTTAVASSHAHARLYCARGPAASGRGGGRESKMKADEKWS
jgi:hypothetical protein